MAATASPDELEQALANRTVGSRLLFENEAVRVWEIALGPGERLPFHRHVTSYFYRCHSGGRLRAKRIRQVRKRVKLVVKTSEAATVVVRTRATVAGKQRTLARTRIFKLRKKGAKAVRLGLTKAGRQAVKRKKTRRMKVTVNARAFDKAGNKRTKTLRRTLRR